MFHRSFPGPWCEGIACEGMGESLGWACHPHYIYTMQGIQNLWELPGETLSQTSSKKIGKIPHATYTNGWGRRKKKSEKTLLYPAFNLSYDFANCAEIIFTKATTCSPSQRTEISSTGPALPTRACWGGGNCFTADAVEVLGSQP